MLDACKRLIVEAISDDFDISLFMEHKKFIIKASCICAKVVCVIEYRARCVASDIYFCLTSFKLMQNLLQRAPDEDG